MSYQDGSIDMFYRRVGRAVRAARENRMTQAELADRIGVARASIANLEAGRQRIPLHVLAMIALELAVEPATLWPDTAVLVSSVTPSLDRAISKAPDNASQEFLAKTLAQLGPQEAE